MKQKVLIVSVIIIILVGLISIFLFKTRGNSKIQVNTELKRETIVLQDGYSFTVNIPSGYLLIPGLGDYINYVVNEDDKRIIGFQKSNQGGESSPMGSVIVDGVPFIIDYRKNIGCPSDMYPTKIKTGGGNINTYMLFGIYTWCEDDKETESEIYEQIVGSIKFNNQLKDVLLGFKYAPLLKK